MKEFIIKGISIYKNNYSHEVKYRNELSNALKNQLGEGPYSEMPKSREAIEISYNYFCDRFVDLCHCETSVRFYQFVMSQHEGAIQLAFFEEESLISEELGMEYIALYRRILKWILEQACDIKLLNQETYDQDLLERAKNLLNELVFLGEMIYSTATLYAEQDMIEDVVEVTFDEEGLYKFKHKHHYDHIIGEIQNTYGAHSIKHVVDNDSIESLKIAFKECFNIDYRHFADTIAGIHSELRNKGGQYCGFGWESLPMSAQSIFRSDPDSIRILYKGLTLDCNNKLKLHDLVIKPYSMFRYLYRPISIWNIEGADFAIVGKNAFTEAIIQLCTNAIPWGKAPEEWMRNACFKKYVHSKEDEHDKWLDDEVESLLVANNLHYFRNVKTLKTDSGNLSLLIKNVGEIDFIIVDHNSEKIFIVDCKHLMGRYDMMSQKNDLANFVKTKGYNTQISNKINWIKDNLQHLNYHYSSKYGVNNREIIEYSVEGFFIINTPTFYMFNSNYRIYTVDVFLEMITGKKKDPKFTILDDDKTYFINYPYFRKPTRINFDT